MNGLAELQFQRLVKVVLQLPNNRPASGCWPGKKSNINLKLILPLFMHIDILTCMQISWDDNHWLYKNVDILSVMLDMSSWMQDRMYEKKNIFLWQGHVKNKHWFIKETYHKSKKIEHKFNYIDILLTTNCFQDLIIQNL